MQPATVGELRQTLHMQLAMVEMAGRQTDSAPTNGLGWKDTGPASAALVDRTVCGMCVPSPVQP